MWLYKSKGMRDVILSRQLMGLCNLVTIDPYMRRRDLKIVVVHFPLGHAVVQPRHKNRRRSLSRPALRRLANTLMTMHLINGYSNVHLGTFVV